MICDGFIMSRKRTQISITLPEEVLKWLDAEIEKVTFANRSHGIEYALNELRKKVKATIKEE